MVKTSDRLRVLVSLLRLNFDIFRVNWIANLIYGMAIPLILFAWGSSAASGGSSSELVAGTLVIAATLSVLRGLGQQIAIQRFEGGRALLQTSLATPGLYLASCVATGVLTALLALLAIVPPMLLAPELVPSSFSWLLPYALLVVFLGSVGLIIAETTPSPEASGLLTNLLPILVIAICPLLYPAERVPAAIQSVVAWLPPSLGAQAIAAGWEARPVSAAALGGLLFADVLAAGAFIEIARRVRFSPLRTI